MEDVHKNYNTSVKAVDLLEKKTLQVERCVYHYCNIIVTCSLTRAWIYSTTGGEKHNVVVDVPAI